MTNFINAVQLQGTVTEHAVVGPDKAVVVQLTTKATVRGEERATAHVVQLPKEFDSVKLLDDEGKLKPGHKLFVFGTLSQRGKRTIVVADRAEHKPKNAPFVNLAKARGVSVRALDYFAPRAGKAGFANLLIRVGESMFVRAVTFSGFARTLNSAAGGHPIPPDSEIEIIGNLNWREVEGADRETGEARKLRLTEILANSTMSKIIAVNQNLDPFKGTPAESPAPEMGPAQDLDDGIPF